MREILTPLFAEIRPEAIIETGTHKATGTTAEICAAIQASGIATAFYSIECNPANYFDASKHIADNAMPVTAILGLSIPRELLPSQDQIRREYVEGERPEVGYYDHAQFERATMYFAETDFNVKDRALQAVLDGCGPVGFYLLDSAGHVGLIEFNYLLGLLSSGDYLLPEHVYFCLDDTRHCKHFETLRQLRGMGAEIVHESADRFGWAIAKLSRKRILKNG